MVNMKLPNKKYKTILIDPPWEMGDMPQRKDSRKGRKIRPAVTMKTPYPTMSYEQIKDISINNLADMNCHLWLWVTNKYLPNGFELIDNWGFKYFTPIIWVKPSGFGMWFVQRTETLLFAYKDKLKMNNRCKPNVIFANHTKHSKKPVESYTLIESVSSEPYIELFARERREGWDAWGDELSDTIQKKIKG